MFLLGHLCVHMYLCCIPIVQLQFPKFNVQIIPNNCFHFSALLISITAWISTFRQFYVAVCQCSLRDILWWSICKLFFSCTLPFQPVSSTFISDSNFLYFPECFLTTLRQMAEYTGEFQKENSPPDNKVDIQIQTDNLKLFISFFWYHFLFY